jgi:glycosidase
LKSLGITIIYFNPIFGSGSNHGYDTRDYQTIEHYFGNNATFKK